MVSVARATLTIEFDDAAWKDALLFRLNGEELRDGTFAPAGDDLPECCLNFPVGVPPLREGRNFVEVAARHVDLPDGAVTFSAMRLKVEYA